MEELPHDTAETIEDPKYMYFDMAVDSSPTDFEEAMRRYRRLLAGFSIDSWQKDTDADLF